MAAGRGFLPDFLNRTIGPNPDGGPHNPEVRLSKEAFHSPGAICLNCTKILVGNQREIQLELSLEFRQRLNAIAAAPNHDRVEFLKVLHCVTKLGRFIGSTGSIGLRKKIENYILAAKIAKGDFLAVVGRQAKVGRLITCFKHSIFAVVGTTR
jgi:hypothetical protein